MYNGLDEKMEAGAGIRLHVGKTRVWNRASVCPLDVVDLGAEVWNPEGVKILGVPVGSRQFVHKVMERVDEERKLHPTRSGLGAHDLPSSGAVRVSSAALATIHDPEDCTMGQSQEEDLLDSLEQVQTEPRPPTRRVVLVPQSGGTPQSVQDRVALARESTLKHRGTASCGHECQ